MPPQNTSSRLRVVREESLAYGDGITTAVQARAATEVAQDALARMATAWEVAEPVLARMYADEGWRLLGYDSWRGWARAEFATFGQTALYRHLGRGLEMLRTSPVHGGVLPRGKTPTLPAISPPAQGSPQKRSVGRPRGSKPAQHPAPASVAPAPPPPADAAFEQFTFQGERLAQLRALAARRKQGTAVYLDRLVARAHEAMLAADAAATAPLPPTPSIVIAAGPIPTDAPTFPGYVATADPLVLYCHANGHQVRLLPPAYLPPVRCPGCR